MRAGEAAVLVGEGDRWYRHPTGLPPSPEVMTGGSAFSLTLSRVGTSSSNKERGFVHIGYPDDHVRSGRRGRRVSSPSPEGCTRTVIGRRLHPHRQAAPGPRVRAVESSSSFSPSSAPSTLPTLIWPESAVDGEASDDRRRPPGPGCPAAHRTGCPRPRRSPIPIWPTGHAHCRVLGDGPADVDVGGGLDRRPARRRRERHLTGSWPPPGWGSPPRPSCPDPNLSE